MGKEIVRFTVDFDKLKDYRFESGSKLPIHCFGDIYKLIGLYDSARLYYKDNNISDDDRFVICESIFAHPDTIVKIRKLIQNNWKCYDITIDRDKHVFWKPNSKYGESKHYAKRLTGSVRNSVDADFMMNTPGPDADLPLDVIVFRVPEKKEEKEN